MIFEGVVIVFLEKPCLPWLQPRSEIIDLEQTTMVTDNKRLCLIKKSLVIVV